MIDAIASQMVSTVCQLIGHKFRTLRQMTLTERKVVCVRCNAAWAMCDKTRSFVPWDGDLEELYAFGGLLSNKPSMFAKDGDA